jgi:propanediol dehydratase small subunit
MRYLKYLPLICLLLSSIDPYQQKSKVKIRVEATNDVNKNASSRIISCLNSQISKLAKATVTTAEDEDYLLAMNLLVTADNNNQIQSVVLAPVLSKKIITKDDRTTFETKFCQVIEANVADIEKKCQELVAKMDVQYFQK